MTNSRTGNACFPEDAGAAGQRPPASYPVYKFEKAVYDYQRVHDRMLAASPDHQSFDAHRVLLQELRFAIDDVLADAVATWDAVRGQVLDRAAAKGKKVTERLAELARIDPQAHDRLQRAWSSCFEDLNSARNFKQHEGFWPPHFGFGQGGSPFVMDLILPGIGTPPRDVYLMREARYGLALLTWLDDDL